MSSLRAGHGLPATPSEGLRTRRPREPGQSGGLPKPVNREGKADAESPPKTTIPALSQSRLPSRVPQPAVAPRQAGRPQAARRPSLDHQATSWGSTSTTASSRSKSHDQSGSGSSSSSRSQDSNLWPARNVLRRKKSSISQDVAASRKGSQGAVPSVSIPRSKGNVDFDFGTHVDRHLTESPGEIQPSDGPDSQRGLAQSPVIYPELDRYRDVQQLVSLPLESNAEIPYKLSTQDLPPPTPASQPFSGSSSQLSASPSTKFSGSPGPGPYSRDTTPTSISSQSPGLTSTTRFNPPKGRQPSPAQTRPPVTRRRAGSTPNEVDAISADPHGLAAVRESLNSSSSSSTVKDGDRNLKERKPARPLAPLSPSPPPRKSSQKFSKSSEGEKKSPSKPVSRSRSGSTSASSQKSTALPPPAYASSSPSQHPAPRRPSRDGAPDIQSQLLSPAPVVHSNLSSTSLPAERRGSGSNDLVPPSHQRAKNASTSQLPVGKDEGTSSKPSTERTGTKSLGVPEATRPSRTPSPNVGPSFRFPFFGRKKNASESPPKAKRETKEKKPTARKGPAAGTGHEGYGRLGAVRRRSGSSSLSQGFADTQTSQESLVSNDAFFADRMNPVVIAGGGVVENRNASSELSRTESNQSPALSRPSTESNTGADMPAPDGGSRTAIWPSPVLREAQVTSNSRRTSDSSDSDGGGMKSTLAFRRSIQRLRTSPDNPMRMPQPIDTSGTASSPMTSFDTSVMSDESHFEMQHEMSRGRDAVHPTPKKLTKRERSPRKWTLFGRSQKQTVPKKDDQLAASVQPVETEKKPVAFYTMMDPSEQDVAHGLDVQDVLRSAEVYSQTPQYDAAELQSSAFQTPEPLQAAVGASPQPSKKIYHDPFPMDQPLAPKAQVQPPPSNTTLRSGRPSRLQQVGRIPKVASTRQEQPSPKSFSRPFRSSLQSPPQPSEYLDPESIAKGPSPPNVPSNASNSVPDVSMEGPTSKNATEVPSHGSTANITPGVEQDDREFLHFSPRKDSEGTVGTSSSSGMLPFSDATAVIPRADDPPAEDEVWDEFNDLLEDETTRPRLSATSSKGVSFHLETSHSRLAREKPMESPTLAPDRVVSAHSLAPTSSSCYSADMTERIRNAFQPHPTSPWSGPPDAEKGQDEPGEQRGWSTVPAPRRSLSPIKERNSDTSYSSSEDGSPLSQVNLRVGSMTVSKWLTFGHVLFSDVRHELIADEGSLKRRSILVIDGLGNDDWSFYAAETYPAATFFNLSPRAPLPAQAQGSPSFPASPPNHHQIQYVSHLDKFPFAPQSFTSVVYRFPVAATESHYRNILSEARRVLKPGGYLELSILDVDLNNMGNRGRRAVRQLKERIHAMAPGTSLASTADLMVRLTGNAGFYDVKAARVGVPVASPIDRSHGSIKAQDRKAASKTNKHQASLSDMMSDDSATADESITKMVARVGRWWYTRCYESAADPGTPTTIWNDKALLRECEELGTSLKLMVCCGRAPDRVSSV